jgi:hypothetical protein
LGEFIKAIFDVLESDTHAKANAPKLALFSKIMSSSKRLPMPSSKPFVRRLKGYLLALAAISDPLKSDEKRPRTMHYRVSLGCRNFAAL